MLSSIILFFSLLFIFSINSFIGYFKNVPLLNSNFVLLSLCIPKTLLFSRFKIGEPEEPGSVEQ